MNLKISEAGVVGIVGAIIVAGMLWNINNQMLDIKYRAFRIGCMDSGKLKYDQCSGLAKQYVDGTLDISKLEHYNVR